MGCLEKKPERWDKPGKYRCKKCEATANGKKNLCEPKKAKKPKPK